MVIAATPADAAKRLALVIGNNAYEEVEALDRAVADARAYRSVLEEQRGFKVYYAEDAGRREMNTRVAEFLAAIRPGDTAMIVYSGHGVQLDSERRDSLYLLPTDFPNRDPGRGAERHFFDAESLNFARLAENVAARGAKLRIFVLDACRNNPFSRKEGTRAIGVSRGIGRIQSSSGEFVIYAAAPGEVAFDSLPGDTTASENSLFTRSFIKHFRTGAYLEDVANDVQAEVVGLARAADVEQEPYYSDGVAGRTCLEENCGFKEKDLLSEQEEYYWKFCEENDEPLYCRAFLDSFPESWRAGLAKARLKVLLDQAAVKPDTDKTPDHTDAGSDSAPRDGVPAEKDVTKDGKPADADVTNDGTPPDGGEASETELAARPKTGNGDTASNGESSAANGADEGIKPIAKDKDAATDEVPPKTGAGGETPRTSGDGEDIDVAVVDPKEVTGVSTDPITPTRDQVRDIQTRLTVLGHRPGPIDGWMGRRTRKAILAFQKKEKMSEDGNVSEALIAALTLRVPDETLQAFHADQERRRREAARSRTVNRKTPTRTTTRTTTSTTTPKTEPKSAETTTTPTGRKTGDRTVTVGGVKVRTNVRLREPTTGKKPFYCDAQPSRQWWDDECR